MFLPSNGVRGIGSSAARMDSYCSLGWDWAAPAEKRVSNPGQSRLDRRRWRDRISGFEFQAKDLPPALSAARGLGPEERALKKSAFCAGRKGALAPFASHPRPPRPVEAPFMASRPP